MEHERPIDDLPCPFCGGGHYCVLKDKAMDPARREREGVSDATAALSTIDRIYIRLKSACVADELRLADLIDAERNLPMNNLKLIREAAELVARADFALEEAKFLEKRAEDLRRGANEGLAAAQTLLKP